MAYLYRNVKDLLEPDEIHHDCPKCGNPKLSDEIAKCDVCGKTRCIECTEELGRAIVCKGCIEDNPDTVIKFLATALDNANLIAAAKDRYIDQIRGVA
jgi:hypothetical protein